MPKSVMIYSGCQCVKPCLVKYAPGWQCRLWATDHLLKDQGPRHLEIRQKLWPVTREMFPFDDVIMVTPYESTRTDSITTTMQSTVTIIFIFHGTYCILCAFETAKMHGSILVRHRSDTFAPNRCLIDVDQRLFTIWACFLPLTRSKLRLCSANHRAGYFSNLACDWLSIVRAYSELKTENGPWFGEQFVIHVRAWISNYTHVKW